MKTAILKSLLLVSALLSVAPARAAEPPPYTPVQPKAINNWQDKRFGMFIHWGPVSLTAHEIGWSRGAQTPIEVYDNLYKQFNPTNFNADAWVKVAKDAGMKYIVLTTKHHDGFCLWDTKLTDFNIMNSPFKRDVVKELSAACKRAGIAFGTYYSTCDWHHPDFPLTSPGGRVKREKSDLDSYNRYLLGQITELITNYGPLITIWNDVPQMFQGRGTNTINLIRKLQPDITVNNRTGDGGDYDTPEQRIGKFQIDRPWESCMTLSAHNAWAWGGTNDGVKPLSACLDMLIRGAGGGGNVLLNVGPRPDGVIDPAQANRLREMGAWLARNGESIYGTRGGPWKPTQAIVSTRKGNTVFVHVLRPQGDTVVLPNIPRKIVRSSVLTGGRSEVTQSGDQISIRILPAVARTPEHGAELLLWKPKAPPAQPELDTIVKLELDGSAMDIVPVALAGHSDSLAIGAKARASNVYQKNGGYSAAKAFDDDMETRWATDSGTNQVWLEVDLGKTQTFSKVAIHEWDGGQRIRKFEVQYQDGDAWKTIFAGTRVGTDFAKSFPAVTARVVRLNILAATDGPTIDEFEILK